MPPQISEDEDSDVFTEPFTKTKKKVGNSAATPAKQEPLRVESDHDEDVEDKVEEEEVEKEEYIVEKIVDHMIDEDGHLIFKIKWEGFERKIDQTWEPEHHLETASEVLDDYFKKVGGKDPLIASWQQKKDKRSEKKGKKGKKRARASTGTESGVNGSKRGKKSSTHPETVSPPASAKHAEFKVPTGSWEDEVVAIDACEGSEGKVVVYLTWKGGEKSQHALHQVYKRCPQKMLQFYENHLVFKKNDDES